jgi:hypothetical protein
MSLELFLKKVIGVTKLEDGMKRLDKLTDEEVRMANAEVLSLAHDIGKKVQSVGAQVKAGNLNIQQMASNVVEVKC